MSRRGVVLTIFILGMVASSLWFLRSNNKNADAPTPRASASSSGNIRQEHNSNEHGNASAESAATLSESNSSSSAPASRGGPARGARGTRPLRGASSYNIQGVRLQEDPVFAGSAWKILKGVVAYPKAQGEAATLGRRLGEVNGYYLVDEGGNASADAFDPAKPLVVFRADTRTAGIVTGNFSVVLEEGASADFLAQAPQLKIVSSFPDIQTYYVTSSQWPFSLKALQDSLRDAPEVKEVKMEILDRQYEKF